MIKREFKVNSKSFLVWSIVLIAIFMLVFLVYPSIVDSPEMKSMDEMLAMFPEEILKAFNMDLASLDSAYGWLKSEGFVFVLLIVGCYAGILGSNILLKEENDKTIEYINSLPIKRNTIVLIKVLVGVTYILLMCLTIGVFNYIGLYISGEFDVKQYVLLSITPILPSLVIFFVCMFFSTFMHKTKKMLGASLGIVLVSYFLNVLSTISSNVESLKYFSVFTLADIRNVIVNTSIDSKMIVISGVLSIIFLILTLYRYNRKELV